MAEKNIILIGFMGVGKTTLGKKLSHAFQMSFMDTDYEIERREGMDIAAIFREKGEPYFRSLESAVAQELSRTKGCVVATGGGMIKNADNVRRLKENGIIVYLKAGPEKIYNNLKYDNSRPLLFGGDKLSRIKELLRERTSLYESCADIVFDVSGRDIKTSAAGLAELLEGKI